MYLVQTRSPRSQLRICRSFAKSISLNRRGGIKVASIFFSCFYSCWCWGWNCNLWILSLDVVDDISSPRPNLPPSLNSALLIWTLLFWLQVWLLCCIRFGRRFKFQGKVEDLVPSCTLHVNTVKWSSRDIAFNHTTDVRLPADNCGIFYTCSCLFIPFLISWPIPTFGASTALSLSNLATRISI
jgi:hypothetical protein